MSSYGSDSYDDSQTSDDSYEGLSTGSESSEESLHSSDWTISDSDTDDTWSPGGSWRLSESEESQE